MLLIVGLVVCAGGVLVFVPLVECEACVGVGTLSFQELERLSTIHPVIAILESYEECGWCEMTGTTTGLRGTTCEPEPFLDLTMIFSEESLREILLQRKSTH